MTEPILPGPVADLGDAIVDRILDLIDAEPDPNLRTRLLERAAREEWVLHRFPGDPTNPADGGRIICRFGDEREYVIPLLRDDWRPRARWTDA
jgi:hypothetical protein